MKNISRLLRILIIGLALSAYSTPIQAQQVIQKPVVCMSAHDLYDRLRVKHFQMVASARRKEDGQTFVLQTWVTRDSEKEVMITETLISADTSCIIFAGEKYNTIFEGT